MSPTAVPTRITIDFRDAIHPSRTWILGVGSASEPERLELLAFEAPSAPSLGSSAAAVPRPRPAALTQDCACPDFCERDHANE